MVVIVNDNIIGIFTYERRALRSYNAVVSRGQTTFFRFSLWWQKKGLEQFTGHIKDVIL